MKNVAASFLLLVLVLLGGCGNLNGQSRSFATERSSVMTVDASQRAIFTTNKQASARGKAGFDAICAEPSPDAMVAVAAALNLNVSVVEKALGAGSSYQQSAANIGLRTQTIQILRDAMYRLCEGYASGALDQKGFLRLQRRYQHIMLGLLSIEQLTGPLVAQQVALSGTANSLNATNVAAMSTQVSKATDALAKATVALTAAQTSLAAATKSLADAQASPSLKVTAAAEVDAAKSKLMDAEAGVEAKKTDLKIKSDAYKTAADGTSTSASGEAKFASSPTAQAAAHNAENFKTVAAAVQTITLSIMNKDYSSETCIDSIVGDESLDDEKDIAYVEMLMSVCAGSLASKDPKFAQTYMTSGLERTSELRLARCKAQAKNIANSDQLRLDAEITICEKAFEKRATQRTGSN